jgi:hypothetical protein
VSRSAAGVPVEVLLGHDEQQHDGQKEQADARGGDRDAQAEQTPVRPRTSVATTVRARASCVSRVNTGPTASSPISSASHAWSAPDRKVDPVPHTTWATSTAAKLGTRPCSSIPPRGATPR